MRHFHNRAALTLVIVCLTAVGAAGCEEPGEAQKAKATTQPVAAVVPADFQPHQLKDGAFRFKAPPAWKKAERPGSVAAMTLFIDEQRSSLKVNTVDLGPGEGLKNTVAASEALMPRVNKSFKHEKTEYFQAAGTPAARVSFDVSARGQKLKVMQVLLERGRKVYALTFTAAADKFATLAPTFEQVIASAEFQ